MPFVSYAQNGEDVMLWRALGDVAEGFYVDVGAAHPDEDSVTRAFYDRGWWGINIEPVPAMAERIAASRFRDTTLAVAAGAENGTIALHVLDGTGLSTTEEEVFASLGEAAASTRLVQVPVRRLSSILDEHAPDRIEFLKIDVEGAERKVLEGCDFQRHRPRIVLVEATWPRTNCPSHNDWEHLLLGARYQFAFFDGLNRFYVADEWATVLGPRLGVPVNVLDDYVRFADSLHARWAIEQEGKLSRVMERARVAEEAARAAYSRAFEQARDLGNLRQRLVETEHAHQEELTRLRVRALGGETSALSHEHRAEALAAQVERLTRELAEASHMLTQTRRSTSWRVTKPLRSVSSVLRGRRPEGELADAHTLAPAPAPVPVPVPVTVPITSPDAQAAPATTALSAPAVIVRPVHTPSPFRAVHQFHSGSATGDAVTNSMLLIRKQLRHLGYRSDIFVEHRDPDLRGELRLVTDLPDRPDHVLIVHHSMGYDAISRILAHPAPKVLYYHNITPPRLLPSGPLRDYAEFGRDQLAWIKRASTAAVAPSEFNALDLRRAGFDPVLVSTMLFDVASLRSQAAPAPPKQPADSYNVLFVGRVIESKGQADLVDAFARFRTRLGRPARLVLVGRTDSPGTYLQTIDGRMREHGLEAELVLTGPVSDAELHAQYRSADLYVSLSRHEGFGVPLVEAMAHDIPVLAFGAGAVPYTLGASSGLLGSYDPDEVASAMLAIALDPPRRAALLAEQQIVLDRFAVDRQWPALQEALIFAGAAPPASPATERDIAAHLRYAIFGHTQGSYSLAGINRALAAAIEAERPGRVRLIPVEGALACLPEGTRRLADRKPPETGPEVVISQHYPVHLPDERGALSLALVFWEESLLPAETVATLNEAFDGVLAPSAFVAKVLTDSGLTRPVHVVGQAPDLVPFETIAYQRGQVPRSGEPFTFLHVSSCFPRKGVDVLLAAFASAFRRGDHVRLIIKGFPNPHNTAPEQVAALQNADPDLPLIEVIDQDLDDTALHTLYGQADAMVLPTRGEGFNLPAAEAMAAGVPLIVTGMGGHLDFCGVDTARLVRYRLAPSGSHLASSHSLWAEPDQSDLAAALRELESTRRDPAALTGVNERVQRARVQVRQMLKSRSMIRRLETAALDIMLRPPAAPVVVGWVTSWDVRCGVAEYSRHLIRAMPAHDAIAAHLVLADDRSKPCTDGSPRVRQCWRLGDLESVSCLESAVTAEDPSVLVVQHQPGLMSWELLEAFLTSPVLAGRTVVVTLHNTRHLLDRPLPTQDQVCAALGNMSRVVVHSLLDLHRLQDLGLSSNVTLMPHGVPKALPRRPPTNPGAAPLIGCYGFFLPGKGIDVLIEALALLRRTRPGARLRLVNAHYGVEASENEIGLCRAVAETLNLVEAIEWETSFLSDEESLALLASCDVIVLPTQTSKESSSAAIRMALAAGPVVVGTPLDLFQDVGDALVRAQGTGSADLAASLDLVLSDPEVGEAVQAAAEMWLRAHEWRRVGHLFQSMLLGLASFSKT